MGSVAFRWVLQLHRDVPRAAVFYSKGLGFNVNVWTPRWVELQTGSFKLALFHSPPRTNNGRSPVLKKEKACCRPTQPKTNSQCPEDVIREILVRLPTKSIPRLRLICKSWDALIQSRSFIELHHQSHNHDDHQSQLLFFDDRGEDDSYIEAMDLFSLRRTRVLDIRNLLRALKAVTPTKFRDTLIRVSGINLPRDMIAKLFGPFINVLGPTRPNKFVERTYGYSTAAFCNPATGEFWLISPPHVFEHRLDPLWAVEPIARKEYARFVLKVKQHYGFGSVVDDNGVVVDYKMVIACTRNMSVYRFQFLL